MSIPTVVGDMEPHIIEFWGAEFVINTFLVYPTHTVTEVSLFIGLCGAHIIMSKQTAFIFFHIYMELFIVQLIVCGSVFQVDPGGV